MSWTRESGYHISSCMWWIFWYLLLTFCLKMQGFFSLTYQIKNVVYVLAPWFHILSRSGPQLSFTARSPVSGTHLRRFLTTVLTGGRPILCSPWNNSNIRTLKNVHCDTGLCTFQDIRGKYNVPAHSFFLFFFLPPTQVIFKSTGCLFAASTIHPIYKWLASFFWRLPILYDHLIEFGGMTAPIWPKILIGHKSGCTLKRPHATRIINKSILTTFTEHIWLLANSIVWGC